MTTNQPPPNVNTAGSTAVPGVGSSTSGITCEKCGTRYYITSPDGTSTSYCGCYMYVGDPPTSGGYPWWQVFPYPQITPNPSPTPFTPGIIVNPPPVLPVPVDITAEKALQSAFDKAVAEDESELREKVKDLEARLEKLETRQKRKKARKQLKQLKKEKKRRHQQQQAILLKG